MGQIRFSVKDAETVSGKFESNSKKITSIKGSLDSNIDKVTKGWEGSSQTAFLAQYKKFAPSLDELAKLTTNIAKTLDSISTTKQATEKKIADSFK